MPSRTRYMAVTALLVFWAVRLVALDALPLHNDEGLHLVRAIEVWRGHPFWEIGDGKIVNAWPIAVFYPPGGGAPDFVARSPTVLTALLGLAAGMALARQWAGVPAMGAVWLVWLASPYLFFFERLALSDAQAGALVVVTVWASVRMAETGRRRDAVLVGFALAAATLFKFTAAPYALAVLLVTVLLRQRRCWTNLVTVGAVGAVCFVVPLIYLILKGEGFSIAFRWLGSGASNTSMVERLNANSGLLWDLLWAWGYMLMFLPGLVVLGIRSARGRILLLAGGAPLLATMVLGNEVMPRHYAAALPLMATLAGMGLGMWDQAYTGRYVWLLRITISVAFIYTGAQFWREAHMPDALTLPPPVHAQYIAEHSAGFGLRAAMRALPQTTALDVPIIGSMFPDSCRRANFYTPPGYVLTCPDAPGRIEIEAALATHNAVYVLVDTAPLIGIDVHTLDMRSTRIAAYPRPGEVPGNASVVLWVLEPPAARRRTAPSQ